MVKYWQLCGSEDSTLKKCIEQCLTPGGLYASFHSTFTFLKVATFFIEWCYSFTHGNGLLMTLHGTEQMSPGKCTRFSFSAAEL